MKKFLTITISVIVLFLFIEVFFRCFYPISGYSITTAPWGFRHLPNTTVTFYGEQARWGWGQRGVEVRYNRHGLRSPDYIYHFNGYYLCDTLFEYDRIVLMGDSWVEDMGSKRDNLINIHLQKHINFTYRDNMLPEKIPMYQVINAGHYAFDNAQELMWYEMEGSKYKPDIVFLFYARDEASPEYAEIIYEVNNDN